MKIWLAFFAAVFFAMPAHAGSSVRYALIVANDHGVAPPGVVLADLEHAEREALVIRNRLVRLANFDDSADRVVVLRGKTRAEILAAAKALAEQHRDDRAVLGDVSTLFAFFFTGHGLEGKLLTRDAPLTPTWPRSSRT